MISIPNRRGKRQLLLSEFYRKTVRPKLGNKSKGYRQNFDYAVTAAEKHCGPCLVDDVDSAWLERFALQMKAAGNGTTYCRQQCWLVRRIVSYRNPYQFMRAEFWRHAAIAFSAEPAGCLGNYYLKVFEPNSELTNSERNMLRTSLKAFHDWRGAAVRLSAIDDSMMDDFEDREAERHKNRKFARRPRHFIAKIVNHWRPGTIHDRRTEPPAPGGDGTVQGLAEELIKSKEYDSNMTGVIRTAMRRFYRFSGNKPVPFERFDIDMAEDFLRWVIANGSKRRPVTVHYVNHADRWALNMLSNEAAERGFIKRPLRIPKLPDPKRGLRRVRVSGYKCDPRDMRSETDEAETVPTNVHARATIGPKATPIAPPPPRKDKAPMWDAKRGELRVGEALFAFGKQARSVRPILDLFESAGWPEKIDSPYASSSQQHRDTLYKLNRKVTSLFFGSCWQSTGISWRFKN